MSDNGAYLTRDGLANYVNRRRYREVRLPDGHSLRLQSLTELERQQADIGGPPEQLTARYIAKCLVDGEGRRLYADGQIEEVLQLDAQLTIQLDQAILSHVGMRTLEDTGKNLPEITEDSLPST